MNICSLLEEYGKCIKEYQNGTNMIYKKILRKKIVYLKKLIFLYI